MILILYPKKLLKVTTMKTQVKKNQTLKLIYPSIQFKTKTLLVITNLYNQLTQLIIIACPGKIILVPEYYHPSFYHNNNCTYNNNISSSFLKISFPTYKATSIQIAQHFIKIIFTKGAQNRRQLFKNQINYMNILNKANENYLLCKLITNN